MIHKSTFALSILVALTACSTPAQLTTKEFQTYDKDTKYAVENKSNGFLLTIAYSKYQMIPESQALLKNCKSAFTSIAWGIADKKERKIKMINEQRIRLTTGRNIVTGIGTCEAQAFVEWTTN